MPAHTHEESAVVSVVGRPPILRRRHQRDDVALERLDIEFGEFLGVVEVGTHWIRLRRM
ncbi:hypothetical protein G9444_1315 [Rhodococcus erythropolis]|uniref:Uncharacterized protein n=1 Tax=Rhodococcus erythropolis TaxID=1833 RepID=A0A6G9CP24_RHOER|nr:hypothetical protein G9444_1315 [Rhodococcus erythropolis]